MASFNETWVRHFILGKGKVNIADPENANHYFTKEFGRIDFTRTYHEHRDRLLFFLYFITRLEKIGEYNRKDFDDYLKKLSVDGQNLVGEKFEIFTYARLLDAGMPFTKPDTNPDFVIEIDGEDVFIECGSRQASKKEYFNESIQEAIYKKQINGIKQNYATRRTALHVDITKTVYNTIDDGGSLNFTNLTRILDEAIQRVDFGALVLIANFEAKEDGAVNGMPIIKYHDDCDPKLKELHRRMWHIESMKVTPLFKAHI